MNKYLTLGLVILLPLIALAVVFYYSDYGTYLRLQHKLGQLKELGGGLSNESVFYVINPEFDELLENGYIKYYYQEFDGDLDSPEMTNFWNRASKIAETHSLMHLLTESRAIEDDRELFELRSLSFFIYFIAKEPEYSQLKAILDSTMTPSTTTSVKKPELLGRPHSYWVTFSDSE